MLSFIQPVLSKPARLFQKTALCMVQVFLCLSLLYTSLGISAAGASPLRSVNSWLAQTSTEALESLDVDRAAQKADEASEEIYKGLDTTKRVIGKTDKRNQVIEQAREHASEKWRDLADKAKDVQGSDQDLTLTEKQVLRRVQD